MSDRRSRNISVFVMHLSNLFSGAGTLLLGPTLPEYAHRWALHDSGSGVLLGAQFLGCFAGSIFLFREFRTTLLCEYSLSAVSLLSLALAVRNPAGFLIGAVSLLLLGIGLGQICTTVNILAANRFADRRERASKLSILNFTWSFGALLSPAIAGAFVVRSRIVFLLLSFVIFALLLLCNTAAFPSATERAEESGRDERSGHIANRVLLFYFVLFFLYGGLGSTVSGWLTTYKVRYAKLGIEAGAACTTALWAAVTVGRAGVSILVRFVSETTIRTGGMALATAGIAMLLSARNGWSIGVCSAGIGIGIASFVPITFSLLTSHRLSPVRAGAATANIGLGAAVFPFATGLLASRAASLQVAMATPLSLGFLLVALCFAPAARMRSEPVVPS